MKLKESIAAVMAMLCVCGAVSCGTKQKDEEKKKETTTQNTTETVTEEETTAAETASEGNEEEETKDKSEENNTAKITDYLTSDELTPAMWKVTDPETGNELYMMGTIHFVMKDTFPLPDYIMDVYSDSEGVAVEVNTTAMMSDFSLLQEFYSKMVYTDGTTVKEHLSEETFEKMKEFLSEKGMYNELMNSYMAGFWASQVEAILLMQIDGMNTDGVDASFISMADKDNKEVIDIENIDIQANALTAGSDELLDYMISSTLDEAGDTNKLAEEFAEMYGKWASGDIDALMAEYDEPELPEELSDDYAEYLDIMLFDRNKGMAEKAESYMKNGKKYFFMVGAAHFAGDKGVDDILEEKGYKVERVDAQ